MQLQTDNVKGIIINVISMLMFVAMDSFIKILTQSLPVYEIIFYRCITGIPFFVVFVHFTQGLQTFKIVNVKLQIIRMLLGVVGMFLFFNSYKYLKLGEAASIIYSSPIILTILSIIFFKERVRVHRTVALILGFIGVLLIVKPGGEFNIYSLFPLGGAFTWSLVILTMRVLSKTDHPNAITLYFSIIGTIVGGIGILIFGSTVISDITIIVMLVAMGIIGILAQLLMTIAVKHCDPSAFASSKYINLIFTMLAGYFLFNEILPTNSFIGMVLIIVGGLYMVWREYVLKKTLVIKKGVKY